MTEQNTSQAPLEFDPRFVEENVDYYASAYNRFKSQGTYGFNWSAAIFPGWWFIYRKMYMVGLLFLILSSIPGPGLLVNIFAGFTGNKFYFDQMREKIALGDYYYAGVNKWVYYAVVAVVVLIVLGSCAFSAILVPFSMMTGW